MLRAATLASGSSGNCAVVSDGRVHILIDAGISARRVTQALRALGVEPRHLAGILLTHEHADHVSGLSVLCRQTSALLFTAEPTALALCGRWHELEPRFRVFEPGQRFAVGGLEIGTFPTSHDCACPCGYSVTDGNRTLVLCTDTGVVTPEARSAAAGADTLIGEFNYDPGLLRTGPYPAHLKDRILGERGHLPNEAGGELAAWAASNGARRIIAAHLSQENNTPALALAAAGRALSALGLGAGDVEVLCAPRHEPTGWMEV